MPLPNDLMHAISQLEGCHVVLVVGAGCSAESPTNLPLSSELSRDAYDSLAKDGTLSVDDCSDPDNLSSVADCVWSKKGCQAPLVAKFPSTRFRSAKPNDGHLLAAALLYEQALSYVMTTNFDLALSNAFTVLSTDHSPTVICKPEDYTTLGITNLVYLHGNVDTDPEKWVLRSATLELDWENGWERVITEKIVGFPVTIFVGFGTVVGVLEESTRRILENIRDKVKVYQVDIAPESSYCLVRKLGLNDAYIQMSWVQFMKELSSRLVEEHLLDMQQACKAQIADHNWPDADFEPLCQRIAQSGLLKLGKVRARWLLSQYDYLPKRAVNTRLIADLLIVLALIETHSGGVVNIRDDGVVELRSGNVILGEMILATGLGYLRWGSMEAKIRQSFQYGNISSASVIALIAGISGVRPEQISPPESIVFQTDQTSQIPGEKNIKMFTVDEIRNSPDLIDSIFVV